MQPDDARPPPSRRPSVGPVDANGWLEARLIAHLAEVADEVAGPPGRADVVRAGSAGRSLKRWFLARLGGRSG